MWQNFIGTEQVERFFGQWHQDITQFPVTGHRLHPKLCPVYNSYPTGPVLGKKLIAATTPDGQNQCAATELAKLPARGPDCLAAV